MQSRWKRTRRIIEDGRRVSGAFVTTSWDDGHILDRKLAGLLNNYGLPGTFYIAPSNIELPSQERLGDRNLQALSRDFEIGGHTLTHVRLTTLSDPVAAREITEGKDALEQVTGVKLRSFCYPGGEYGRQHPAMVRDAGFDLARTVLRGASDISPRYETRTSVHAYRHLVDGPAAIRLARGNLNKARQLYWNWDELAMTVFDQVLLSGGVFHLWGHSWEVDKNKDWDRLERVFSYISNRPDVSYIDNGQLAAMAG